MDRLEDVRKRALRTLPGGVSRGFNLLPEIGPIYFSGAHGPYADDVDGVRYLDYIMGWGSLLLGHDPEPIRAALEGAIRSGGFLAQYETDHHIELAELLKRCMPCAEKVRFMTSGLEATQYAIRIARAHTGREKIVKFEGHFHGLHDTVMFNTGGSDRLGQMGEDGQVEPLPGSAGIPLSASALTVVVPYNDVQALESALAAHRGEIAGVIMEPIAMNMGCIVPAPGFLEAVRRRVTEEGAVLIFDEILTGFRVGLQGAQGMYGVTPDLACFSKAFGCGMPIAALAGTAALMEHAGPPGDVPMSGTHSARVLSVIGTLAATRVLMEDGFYEELDARNEEMVQGLRECLKAADVPGQVQGIGGRIGLYIGLTKSPQNLRDVATHWNQRFHRELFRRLILEEQVYGFLPLVLVPDAINLSVAHEHSHIEETLERFSRVLAAIPYDR